MGGNKFFADYSKVLQILSVQISMPKKLRQGMYEGAVSTAIPIKYSDYEKSEYQLEYEREVNKEILEEYFGSSGY